MNATTIDLDHQLSRFGPARIAVLHKTLRAIQAPHVSPVLVLAVGSRESGLRNIVGADGHGRGVFQQDDRFQQASLNNTRGCRQGSYVPAFASALPKGRVPTLAAGCRRLVETIEANVALAIRWGIPNGHRLRFALAAYSAGPGGAMIGWRDHHDADRRTEGGDYSEDIMERAGALRDMA
jgi:hypothetical protein